MNALSNTLKLYLMERADGRVDYDEAEGFIICARMPGEARKLAAQECGGEGEHVWLDPLSSTCRWIGRARIGTSVGVVLRDFNAG